MFLIILNMILLNLNFRFSDSCSDEAGADQVNRHRHHHSKHGNSGCTVDNSNFSRRHKSSSPNRKSLRGRSQGRCGCGEQHYTAAPCSCSKSCQQNGGRSKSAGHMTNEIGGNVGCHCHCKSCEGTRR